MRPVPRIPRRQRGQIAGETARTQDIPAPIGGLNTRDNLALMPVVDAVKLVNWLPSANGLISRNGYIEATTSYTSPVETIIPYVDGTTALLITVSDGVMYTDDGDGTRASIATGLSNSRWFAAKVANNMVLVNGTDAPRNYDGSTVTTPTFSGDLATYGEEKIDGITKFKSRLFMWDSEYGNFFYGGVNSVSGAFAEFNLDQVSNTGGNILEIASISRDAGDGADDYCAFILDTGEILIYQGSDPGDANSWALVGKYRVPPLISKGCAYEFSGDVLLLTRADLIKLSDVIKYGSEGGGFNITPSKLSGAIASDFVSYGSNYGWSITSYPAKGWLIINVPEAEGTAYHQYIVDTVTGSATKFEGWDAIQFGYLNGSLYFGGADLYKADSGTEDNGSEISLIALPAYNNLGIPRRKRVSNARVYFLAEGDLDIDMSLGYDFDIPISQGIQTSVSTAAAWDDAEWDMEDWAGQTSRNISFVAAGIGQYVSAQLKINIQGQTLTWYSTTYNFDIAAAY